MNSYKCVQCGLTNWNTAEFCKRCGVPNPYLNQSFQPAEFSPAAQNNFATQPMMSPSLQQQTQMTPDFSSPPPPNVFGSAIGTTSMVSTREIN